MAALDVPAAARDRAPGPRAFDLFAQFFRREATTRYLGSVTGLAWALVHPIALLAVYYFVFTYDLPRHRIRRRVASWRSSPSRCGRGSPRRRRSSARAVSLPGYGGLIRKVAFPHEVVVYASVAATFALQFAGYVVVLAVLRAIGEPVHLVGLVLAIPLWASWRSR